MASQQCGAAWRRCCEHREAQNADGEVASRQAMARGTLPARTWETSSAKVVSRMWCSASMLQCSGM